MSLGKQTNPLQNPSDLRPASVIVFLFEYRRFLLYPIMAKTVFLVQN